MLFTRLSTTRKAIVCTSSYLTHQLKAPKLPLLLSGGFSKRLATIASGSHKLRIVQLLVYDRRIREARLAIKLAEEEVEKIMKDAEVREYRAGVQAQLDSLQARLNSMQVRLYGTQARLNGTQARLNGTQGIVEMLVQMNTFPITCQILQKNLERKKLGSPIFEVYQEVDSNLEELHSWNHFEELDDGDLSYLGETKEEQAETMRFAAQIPAFQYGAVDRASHLHLALDIRIVHDKAVYTADSTLLRQANYAAKMYVHLLGHEYTQASLFPTPIYFTNE